MDDLTLTQLISRLDDRWHAVLQRLDRTDATHAGISRTLVTMGSTLEFLTRTLERQTHVLERLQTTLERWLDQHPNGQTP